MSNRTFCRHCKSAVQCRVSDSLIPTFPYMESLVGMVGRLCVGIVVFQDGDMSEWQHVGMMECRNGSMEGHLNFIG